MMADLKVVVPVESDPAEAVLAVNAPGYDLLIDEIALRAMHEFPRGWPVRMIAPSPLFAPATWAVIFHSV